MQTTNAIAAEVEIRVPTFRRPDLLTRALESLLNQTWQSWRAVVIDDSTGREAEAVVKRLADDRIIYRPNATNLGRTDNINFCFHHAPFFPASTHACVLEDDNWYDSDWLASNLLAMDSNNALVLARNFRLCDVLADGSILPNDDRVMASLYGDSPRWLHLLDRTRESFFNYSIGNLAYLWRLNAGLDLSMGYEHFHVHVAESGRSVSFNQPCWFEPIPKASFSRFIDKNQTPSGESPENKKQRRLSKVSEIAFTRRIHKIWISQQKRPISEILTEAEHRDERDDALLKLAESGFLPALRQLHRPRALCTVVKSWAVACLYRRAWQHENSKASATR
jgi:glycosyltransferase involved in cell wall biosynthesis